MKIFKELIDKKTIGTGIIASILVILFIEPALKFIWSIILSFGTPLFNDFIDDIYKNAALGARSYLEFLILVGIIFILFITFRAAFPTSTRSIIHKFKKIIKAEKEGEFPEMPSIDYDLDSAESKLKILRILAPIVYFLLVVLCFSVSFLLINIFVDLQANSSFNQRLTVLRPNITEMDELKFKASWASMKSRQDYLRINEIMDSVAVEKGVVLPKLLIK